MADTIVLCGLGRTGSRLLEYLRAANLRIVVIDDRCKPGDSRLGSARLVQGNCSDRATLEQAGVTGARAVMVMTNDDLVNISTTLTVRGLDLTVRIIVRLFDKNLLDRLGQTIHNVVAMSTAMLTAPVLAMTAMTGHAIGAFRLEGQPDANRLVAELLVKEGSRYHGLSIQHATEPHEAVALAHLPRGTAARLLRSVEPSAVLQPGDQLFVCGEPRKLVPLLSPTEQINGQPLRWAGWPRRIWRMVKRTVAEMEAPVLICTSVLVVVVIVSTLVLSLGVTKYRPADAFLRTVSLIATASSMHEDDYKESQFIRVFVSILRILGAVLMAAFTAIVTNYLLRARLGGALEVRRIPDSGHIVVCGLGSIGFLTAEELVRLGERVVVIERDLSNPFVSTIRRAGIPVIIGDAALAEVQAQAHMHNAFSVVVATSHDLINLSVALLAREKNREQRIVVVMSDPQMAGMLRQAAGVDLALSVPALAAPAFLAALFGERVLTVVMVRQHLLAVLDLVVAPDDPLVGKTVDEAARIYTFFPVSLMPATPDMLSTPFAVGHRAVVVVALQNLEPLLNRQPGRTAVR